MSVDNEPIQFESPSFKRNIFIIIVSVFKIQKILEWNLFETSVGELH